MAVEELYFFYSIFIQVLFTVFIHLNNSRNLIYCNNYIDTNDNGNFIFSKKHG